MNYNLVINFAGHPFQVAMLKSYIRNTNSNSEVETLNLNSTDLDKPISKEDQELFGKINSLSKIYIIDHGMPNSPSILSGHYSDISNYIARRLNKDQIKGGKEHLNIELISCSTAVGDHKSFAGLFHRYLGQVHGINADVIARTGITMLNQFSDKKGILTDSLANYTFRVICDDLGIGDFFNKMNPDAHTLQPGSTVTFKWTQEGKEIALDTYVDTFAKMVIKFKNDLYKLVANEKNVPDLILKDISQIVEQCTYSEDLTLPKINQICEVLKKMLSTLQKAGISPDKRDQIEALVDAIIKFRKKAIDTHTIKPLLSESHINKLEPGIEDPIEVIKRDQFNRSLVEFKRISKDFDKTALGDETKKLVEFSCNYCAYRMKNDLPVKREVDVCLFVEKTLRMINNTGVGKNEKIKHINLLKQNIESEINYSVLSSVQGSVEGAKMAVGYGGLTTLKAIFPLANQWSENEKKAVEKYYELIESFSAKAIDFMERTNYEGFVPNTAKEKVVEEGAQYTNSRLLDLNSEIVNIYHMTAELSGKLSLTPEMKTEAKEQIKMAEEKIRSTHRELGKLKFSIANSPDVNVKEVYSTQVIPCISERIDVLVQLSGNLRDLLNSLS